jgi:hypothetical protein
VFEVVGDPPIELFKLCLAEWAGVASRVEGLVDAGKYIDEAYHRSEWYLKE